MSIHNRFKWQPATPSAPLSIFFEKRAQPPRFKSKHSGRQSFHCPQHCKVQFPDVGTKGHIVFPKIGPVKAILHRRFTGTVKTVTVVREASGKYYASVLVDDAQPKVVPDTILNVQQALMPVLKRPLL